MDRQQRIQKFGIEYAILEAKYGVTIAIGQDVLKLEDNAQGVKSVQVVTKLVPAIIEGWIEPQEDGAKDGNSSVSNDRQTD